MEEEVQKLLQADVIAISDLVMQSCDGPKAKWQLAHV